MHYGSPRKKNSPNLPTADQYGGLEEVGEKRLDWLVFMDVFNQRMSFDVGQINAVSERLTEMFGKASHDIKCLDSFADGAGAVLLINPDHHAAIEECKKLTAFIRAGGAVDTTKITEMLESETEQFWEMMEFGSRVVYLREYGLPLSHARAETPHPDLNDMLVELVEENYM